MKKERMLDLVDKMPIFKKDYKIINILLENLEPRLFVKIMEEILEENLFFSDFERLFPDESYAQLLRDNFEKQEALRTEILRLITFRREIIGDLFSQDSENLLSGIPRPGEGEKYFDIYNEISDEERKIMTRFLFEIKETDSDLVRAAKIELRKKIYKDDFDFTAEDFLLFVDNFILPLDFRHQLLNDNDRNFMLENGLTEDEIKQIKMLSTFLKRKEEVIE